MVTKWITKQARSVFTLKQLKKRLPVVEWLPQYTLETALSDVMAGVTVGLTVIPQAIAYALIANLQPQVRL